MWRDIFRFFAFLARLGAFAFSVISLALIALTLAQRDWMDGISIYIVVMGVVSMFAAFVPPYPNFLFDSFFALAWLMCAVFSFLIMFLKSTCYGVADVLPGEEAAVSCPKYQALVAFCFLTLGAWGASAGIGGLLIAMGIFINARNKSHHAMVAPTVYRERHTTTTAGPEDDVVASPPIPPAPAPVYFGETKPPVETEKSSPFADPEEIRPYSDVSHDVHHDDKRPWSISEEKKPAFDDKRPYSSEKGPYPAAYGSTTYHVEDIGESHRASAVAAPVAAAPVIEETDSFEAWERSDPEYYTAPGWMAGFIQRHWLLLGFLGLIGAAILLPIIVIYAVPAFAYYITDNIQLPRNFYGAITGFYEDYATFDIHTSFRAPAGISAKIQPTTLQMFIGDTIDDPIPVAYVETTGFKIGGGKVVEAYNQTLRIGNLTEWSRLWRKFAFQDEMEIGIAGEIKLKTGPITVGVDTKKVQKFQGLLNATKLELEYLRITPPDADGANIVVALPVTNPSPLTVDSGAGATADVLLGDVAFANVFLDEFKLQKGTGTLVARARVDPGVFNNVLSNAGELFGSLLPGLGRGMGVATIQSTAILQDGVAWPYWVAGAQAIKLAAAVEIIPLLGSAAGDILGDLFTGQAGSFFGLEPMTQVIDVNVTAINKILTTLKPRDAVELGLAEPPVFPDD